MTEFAYRPILEEATQVARSGQLDPYEAYAWLYEEAAARGLHGETYASTSITSGGHARDDSLDMLEVITRNTESARLLAEQLAIDGQIDPRSTIEPVFVGKTGWTQAEYMEFWLAVIAGADLTNGFAARDIDALRLQQRIAFSQAEIDFDLMNSHESAAARAEQYFKLASVSAGVYQRAQVENTPMRQVVRMIDTDLSLGAQAERVFARELGVRVMNICVLQPATVHDLAKVNHTLAEDTQRLIEFGATVFDTANKQVRLVLVEEAA